LKGGTALNLFYLDLTRLDQAIEKTLAQQVVSKL
jgi:hypothetical protein